MLKSKIAMALAAAMVMAALYGCSSSSKDTQPEGQVDTTKLRVTAEELGITVPPDATAQAIADLIAGYEPEVSTTDPVENEKAAKVVGPAILASDPSMDADAPRTNMSVNGTSATDNLGTAEAPEDDVKLKMTEMPITDLTDKGFDGAAVLQADNATETKAATVVDTVYVHTNQEPKTAQEYDAYFAGADDNLNGAEEGVTTVGDGGDMLDPLTLANDEATAHPASDSLPSANLSFLTYEDDATTEADENEASFAGMFRGVAGMYACVVTGTETCRAERDKDGKVSFSGGVWTFTPTEPDGEEEVKVEDVVPDDDYLTFGFWLRETTDAKGVTTATIETLYRATPVYEASTAAALVGDNAGKATYSGAATGKYVRKEFDSAGAGTVVAGGAFTADADLTAYFGEPATVAAVHQQTVSGSITNFMSDGSAIDDMWVVKLMGVVDGDDRAAAVDFSTGTGPFTGTTIGDANGDDKPDAAAGAWEGLFAGPTMKAAPTEGLPNAMAPIQPGGIVGEFNGHFTNGHVVGAFGATLDE